MDALKSKKMWMMVLGAAVAVILAHVLMSLGLGVEITGKAVMAVLGLAGLQVASHTVSDAVSMAKGLQETKEEDTKKR